MINCGISVVRRCIEILVATCLIASLLGFENLDYVLVDANISDEYYVAIGQTFSIPACKVSEVSEGTYFVLYKGLIPLRAVNVTEIKRPVVKLLGTPVLAESTSGVRVSAFSTDNYSTSPAEIAGIRVNDLLVSINDIAINCEEDTVRARQTYSSEPIKVVVSRDGRLLTFNVSSADITEYRLGIKISSENLMLGTTSFMYKNYFCAIGHGYAGKVSVAMEQVVSHPCTLVDITSDTSNATVDKVREGTDAEVLLETNSGCGGKAGEQWGTLDTPEFELGWSWEVHTGDAMLYTTLADKVVKVPIVISQINATQDGYPFEVKCNDTSKLGTAGGFIHGMSGSPIVQDGRLVAVLSAVNGLDSSIGFCIPADRMFRDIITKVEGIDSDA